jgi:hypothetical protein
MPLIDANIEPHEAHQRRCRAYAAEHNHINADFEPHIANQGQSGITYTTNF